MDEGTKNTALGNIAWNMIELGKLNDKISGAIDKCIADLHDMVTLSCKLENQQANLEYAVKHIDRIRSNLKIHIGKVTDLNDEIRDVLSDFVLEKHQSNNND